MKNFSRNRDPRDNRRERGERSQMHSAVCAACGKNCEVPFKPTGDKPVYCSSCFGKEQDFSSRRRDDGNRRRDKEPRKMFSAQCANCGIRCEIPFRPTGDKPVYCSSCYEKVNQRDKSYPDGPNKEKGGINKADISIINDQLVSINRKLEKLILVLTPEEKKVSVVKPKIKEKISVNKKEIKKIVKKIKGNKK